MQFNIEEFYPSVSKHHLINAKNDTKSFITISKEEINAMKHFWQSLLHNETSKQIKKKLLNK